MTPGLVALALVLLAAVAAMILFVWREDARRNEQVAHDPERVERDPGQRPPNRPGE